MDNVKHEDLNICRECGGMCCKKSGCDYAVGDFNDRSMNGLLEALAVGDKSIVSMINFETLPNGKFIAVPFLYVRARNCDRDIVDLVSMKTTCSMLTDSGCSYDYDHRPFGGRNLVPRRRSEGPCRPDVNPLDKIMEWEPYQKQLRKIVKRFSGKSVEEKIREDVEQLFYDTLAHNFKGVHKREMEDLEGFIPLLVRAYPEERVNALNRCRRDGKIYTKK